MDTFNQVRMMIKIYCSSGRRKMWEMKKQMVALTLAAALQDEGRCGQVGVRQWHAALLVLIYGMGISKKAHKRGNTHRHTH